MKINESIGMSAQPPSPAPYGASSPAPYGTSKPAPYGTSKQTPEPVANSTPSSRAELLVELRYEFEDFVAHIRHQLELASESLVLLTEEHLQLANANNADDSADVQLGEFSSAPPDPISVSETWESELEPHAVSDNESEANGESPYDGTADSDDPAQESNDWEEASHDANFPTLSDPTNPPTSSPRIVPAAAEATRPAASQSSIDSDADPFERLNAIKARLARQIEQS